MTSPRKHVFDNKVVLFKTNTSSYLYSYIPSSCTLQLPRWSPMRIYYRSLKTHENIFHRIPHLNRRNDLERMSIFRILSITMAQNIEEFKSNAFISSVLCNIVYAFDTYARMKLDNLELANSSFNSFEILLETIPAFGDIAFNLLLWLLCTDLRILVFFLFQILSILHTSFGYKCMYSE